MQSTGHHCCLCIGRSPVHQKKCHQILLGHRWYIFYRRRKQSIRHQGAWVAMTPGFTTKPLPIQSSYEVVTPSITTERNAARAISCGSFVLGSRDPAGNVGVGACRRSTTRNMHDRTQIRQIAAMAISADNEILHKSKCHPRSHIRTAFAFGIVYVR